MQFNYLLPDLIHVEERPDLRRYQRIATADLRVELTTPAFPHPIESHCLNLSRKGIALLCDERKTAIGDRVCVKLWCKGQGPRVFTGNVVRIESSTRFTRLAIQFDD